jgi:hypothetical protein
VFLAVGSVDILSPEISEMASSGTPTGGVGEYHPAVTGGSCAKDTRHER